MTLDIYTRRVKDTRKRPTASGLVQLQLSFYDETEDVDQPNESTILITAGYRFLLNALRNACALIEESACDEFEVKRGRSELFFDAMDDPITQRERIESYQKKEDLL